MSNLVDPLKVGAYGVKRPLEEKQDKIKELEANHKRYYPIDNHGQLDEWGAVIKYQEEQYKNEMEKKRLERKQHQQQYFAELSKGIEDKKRHNNFDKMVHDNDASAMLNKQREVQLLQRGLQERQNEDKAMLGQIYQTQIDQKNKRLNNELQMEKELERMQIERVKGIDPDAYNRMRKEAYQKEVREDLEQRKKMKQYEESMRMNSVRESKKMIDDYSRKELQNEQEYKRKFAKFDQGMINRQKNYSNYVIKPTLEKQSKLDLIENKNVTLYNQKRAENELEREAWRKAQLMSTVTEQKNQMSEHHKMKGLDSEFRKLETQNTSARVNEINTFDQMLKEDKKKRQNMYREMLSNQIQYNKNLKAMGNMTYVEKKMNRADLRAYKHYGAVPKDEKASSKKSLTYEEQQRRLDAYGYGRYISKAPSVNVIENYNDSAAFGRGSKNMQGLNKSYTVEAQPYRDTTKKRDLSAAPRSRRHMNSSRGLASERSLRNAGAVSVSQERKPAGSPSGIYQYTNQVL
ncbi:unnamed protein product [Moneuplotes crassus]|uniref:Uncharacterized protein n=1 Tax=Euplotes crassus TaxID=5936 RepID=A0AAD1UCQ4_EUPCR|nr:unnamed protein product [Moneuplotes crassus]